MYYGYYVVYDLKSLTLENRNITKVYYYTYYFIIILLS